ncbi:MAG: hypothetical protein AB7I27_05435 [Bacteriovoracaceae bacterium]
MKKKFLALSFLLSTTCVYAEAQSLTNTLKCTGNRTLVLTKISPFSFTATLTPDIESSPKLTSVTWEVGSIGGWLYSADAPESIGGIIQTSETTFTLDFNNGVKLNCRVTKKK